MNTPQRRNSPFFIFLLCCFLAVMITAWQVKVNAATISTLGQLPTSAGGVFTQDNLDKINSNSTIANTNFTNVNSSLNSITTILGAAPAVFYDTGTLNLTLSQLQTLNSVGYTILAATSMYQMGGCTLNLTYGSAAFTGGGTVTIGYGTTSSPATNGTIASTVFTTFSASHAVVVLPVAVAVTATTSLANKAIVMTAASADFAAGTGATGQLDCQYRILNGVS